MTPQQTTYLSPERKCCSRETIEMSVSTYLAKCSVKRPKQMKNEGTPQSRRAMIDQDSIRFRSAFTVISSNSEKKVELDKNWWQRKTHGSTRRFHYSTRTKKIMCRTSPRQISFHLCYALFRHKHKHATWSKINTATRSARSLSESL